LAGREKRISNSLSVLSRFIGCALYFGIRGRLYISQNERLKQIETDTVKPLPASRLIAMLSAPLN